MFSRRSMLYCAAALLLCGLFGLHAFADHKGKPHGGGKGGPPPPPGPLTNPALAYVDGDLRLATSDGSTTGLTSDGFAPAWDPDGSRIGFLRFATPGQTPVNLYAINPDGTGLTLLHDFVSALDPDRVHLGPPFPDSFFGVDWSPDGTKILYSSEYTPFRSDLWVLNLATGQLQELGLVPPGVTSDRQITDASIGPDLDPATPGYQGLVAYSQDVAGSDYTFDIHVVEVTTAADGSLVADLATDQTLVLAGEQRFVQWSPDGTQIAFLDTASFTGGRQLMVVTFDVASLTFETPQLLLDVLDAGGGGGITRGPTWSPDGQWIAFRQDEFRRKKDDGIYRIRPDGTGLTRMVAGDWPHWNPVWTNDID